jgi:hypothetical protein
MIISIKTGKNRHNSTGMIADPEFTISESSSGKNNFHALVQNT